MVAGSGSEHATRKRARSGRGCSVSAGTRAARRRRSAGPLVAWVVGLGGHARVEAPPELVDEVSDRLKQLAGRHTDGPDLAPPVPRPSDPAENGAADNGNGRRDPAAIRPERFARLVTLASILIDAGRAGQRLRSEEVCERLQITHQELRAGRNVLNVVNFGGGSYVLYAEVGDDGWVEVDPEP